MTKINIQSISDLITNSSTEVFVIYDKHAVKNIKDTVNSILSLVDSSKTFDDYFEIELCVNYDEFSYVLRDLDQVEYPEAAEYNRLQDSDEKEKYMRSIPNKRVEELFDAYNDSNVWGPFYPYEGMRVVSRVDDPTVNKVASAIAGISSIFELDYSQS